MSTDLVAFIEARLAEDEVIANEVIAEFGLNGERGVQVWSSDEYPHVEMTADRFLADIAAKRKILALVAEPDDPNDDEQVWYQQALADVLRALAAPFASHPDHRPEWRPE